jgi:signal transduction histidine kinase
MSLVPGAPSSRPPPAAHAKHLPPNGERAPTHAADPAAESAEPPTPSPSAFASQPASGTVPRATLQASLLLLSLDAPVEHGPAATGRFLVRELSALLPDWAIGLRVELPGGSGEPTTWIEAEGPIPAEASAAAGQRLFGALSHEVVLDLGLGTSTLHLARRGPGEPPGLPLGLRAAEAEEELCWLLTRLVARCLGVSHAHAQAAAEKERLQAQLLQADKLAALGQITTSVLHELNNPLTSILAYTDWLRRSAERRLEAGEPAEEELRHLGRIAESAERISQYAEELVRHARPAGDRMGRVSLLEVLEKALHFCEHELQRHGVVLERRLEAKTPFVRGVASQLVQIFVNLVTNGIHAASDGRQTLVVQARSDGAWGLVRITDSGRGIAPEHLDHIFEPFFTTKPEGQGTGLGLAIVQELVARHGGTISVESAPGQGASFVVRLPIA